jgi:hypothetical protein
VAQGIGRQPPELKIAGSNPAGRTKMKSRTWMEIRVLFYFDVFVFSSRVSGFAVEFQGQSKQQIGCAYIRLAEYVILIIDDRGKTQ